MFKAWPLILLALVGCASAKQKAAADSAVAEYSECMKSASATYSKSNEMPSDVFKAASSKCEPKYKAMEKDLGDFYYARDNILDHETPRLKGEAKAKEIKSKLRDDITRVVIESRMSAK